MTASIFDICGPIMVGPSSSHTAGALKIGQMARAYFGELPQKAIITLHGSFADVYRGHATDRAIVAGLLQMSTFDKNIRDAFKFARQQKLTFRILCRDLGKKCHQNSVKIQMIKGRKKKSLLGSSIGGGLVKIIEKS